MPPSERRERWFGTPPEQWPVLYRRGRAAYLQAELRSALMQAIPLAAIQHALLRPPGTPFWSRDLLAWILAAMLGLALLRVLGALYEWGRLLRKYGPVPVDRAPAEAPPS